METDTLISIDILRAMFHYDPVTGIVVRKCKTGNNTYVGQIVGSPTQGYLSVMVNGKNIMLHRMIMAMELDYWPEFVDHRDHNRSNNRRDNLRVVTRGVNNHNKTATSKSGVRNVNISPDGGYYVSIRKDGNQHYFGRYKDLDLAEVVALEAADKLYGQPEIQH